MNKPEVLIYTDGAASPNPGFGGWGAVLISPHHDNFRREISGAESPSTNNRMELTAVIRALERLKGPSRVRVFTDSQYVKNAFTQKWLDSWLANSWRTSKREQVANRDLWERLLELATYHDVEWVWVRGHAGDRENQRADQLAVLARKALVDQLDCPE